MPHAHYRLHHGKLLQRLMRCPDTGGTRHTVRSLATIAGVGKSKVGYMLRNRQMVVTADQAAAIARALDLPTAALFAPIGSTFKNADPREENT